jgi:adenine deaminase
MKIVLGTDAVAGAHGRNAEEFVDYRVQDAHEHNMDVIMSGTSVAAEFLGMPDRIGSMAPGMEADIVATEGNPLDDITAVRRVVFVMKGGKVYKNTLSPSHRNADERRCSRPDLLKWPVSKKWIMASGVSRLKAARCATGRSELAATTGP